MAISRVSGQHKSGSNAANTLSITLPSAPTPGNLVVVGAIASVAMTVKDSAGNNYTATTHSPFSGSDGQVGIFYLENVPAGASATITMTATGSSGNILWAQEYSGAATTSVLDKDGTHTNGSSTSINSPSLTAAANGSLYFAVTSAGQTISSNNSPWSTVDAIVFGDGCEDFIQTTAGAQAVAQTQSPAGSWTTVSAIFKAAASGPTISGSIALALLTLSSSLTVTDKISGSIGLSDLTISDTAGPVDTISGSLNLADITLSSSVKTIDTISGNIHLADFTISDTITVGNPTISGSLTLPDISLLSSLDAIDTFSGSLSLPSMTLVGSIQTGSTVLSNMYPLHRRRRR